MRNAGPMENPDRPPQSPLEQWLQRPGRTAHFEALLASLIRIPSPLGSVDQAALWVADRLKEIGVVPDLFEPDLQRLSQVAGFIDGPSRYRGRFCVCARLAGTNSGTGAGKSLILNAHLDTVPIDPDAQWVHPPHAGIIENRRIFGRGAWDDKAGVVMALALALASAFRDHPADGDLVLQFVCDDEMCGNGSLAAIERGYRADTAIILDGTWPERIITEHLGQIWLTIRIHGRTAPASAAWRGRNPLQGAAKLVAALAERESGWNRRWPDLWGVTPHPQFIHVGHLSAGASPFSVPAMATLEIQCGFLPARPLEEVRTELIALVGEVLDSAGYGPESVEISAWGLEPMPWPGHHPLALLLKETIEGRHGREVLIQPVTGHCDLRHFHRYGIPACLYGPGGGKNAHAENEYYELDHFPRVASNIAAFMDLWMGVRNPDAD